MAKLFAICVLVNLCFAAPGFTQHKTPFNSNKPMRMLIRGKPIEQYKFKIGVPFKNFSGTDVLTGQPITLADFRGKIVVLNFWFIHCQGCREEIPSLNTIAHTYAQNNQVVFISVCTDDSVKVKQFLSSSPLAYHTIANSKYVTEDLGVKLYPANVILDHVGRVALSEVGYTKENLELIKNKITELLN